MAQSDSQVGSELPAVRILKVDCQHLPLVIVPKVRFGQELLVSVSICVPCLDGEKVPASTEPVHRCHPLAQQIAVEVILLVFVQIVDGHLVGPPCHQFVLSELFFTPEERPKERILQQIDSFFPEIQFLKRHVAIQIYVIHHSL